jgi:hypothetical protein
MNYPVRIQLGCDLVGLKGNPLADKIAESLRQLPSGTLPLHLACEFGGRVKDNDLIVSILHMYPTRDTVMARTAVFFTEVVGGCSCHDDPVSHARYSLMNITIERKTGIACLEEAEPLDQMRS